MRKWHDDPFSKRARNENFVARSVYKLEEIDQKARMVKSSHRIVDLGAAPGSWAQYCLSANPHCQIWAFDPAAMRVADERLHYYPVEASAKTVLEKLGAEKADLVLSDMAPKTSGIHDADVVRSIALADCALEIARRVLKPSGGFVVKVFMGVDFDAFNKKVKTVFSESRLLRPEGTRKHSREIYLIAKRLRAVNIPVVASASARSLPI